MTLIPILALVFAVAATVLAFIFIVPESKREKLNKLGKFVHDTVNFKYLIVEKILQAMYILCTAYVLLLGFFMLFYVQEGYSGYYYSTPDVWYGGYGLLVMILGPIAVRLAYEFMMMIILLIKNVIQINNKLKDANGAQTNDPLEPATPFAAAPYEAAPAAPAFCPHCGAKADQGSFCSACGGKLQ